MEWATGSEVTLSRDSASGDEHIAESVSALILRPGAQRGRSHSLVAPRLQIVTRVRPAHHCELSAALARRSAHRAGLTATEIGITWKLLWNRDGQVDLERGKVDKSRVRDEQRPGAVLRDKHGIV